MKKFNVQIFDKIFNISRIIVAILIALSVIILLIFFISSQPQIALNSILLGPFSTQRRIGNIIEIATPMIFTGLSASVMFRAKQFSLVGEGSFFFGGLIATIFAINYECNPILSIIIGGLISGIFGVILGYLKAKYDVPEFVVSTMLNSVIVYLGSYILHTYIRDFSMGFIASHKISQVAKLDNIIEGTNVHQGFILAIFTSLFMYILMYKTKYGYTIKMVGENKDFAKYSGINVFNVVIMCQTLGAIIAGIGGSVEILGMYERFQWTKSTNFGFDGIAVAILAGYNPILVPVTAFFMAYLRVGTDVLARNTDIPSEILGIIQAVVMLLVTATGFMVNFKHKMILKKFDLENEV